MPALICDVCGGKLIMDAGGKTATCEYCGLQHSLERLREKIQQIRGTVSIEGSVHVRQTGTKEDVEQWHILLQKYIEASDCEHASQIVAKILEASPDDPTANEQYNLLRKKQFGQPKAFDIINGVLWGYHGRAEIVEIPEGVTIIGERAFEQMSFIKKVIVPEGVTSIDKYAFHGCSVKEMLLPKSLNRIDEEAFDQKHDTKFIWR